MKSNPATYLKVTPTKYVTGREHDDVEVDQGPITFNANHVSYDKKAIAKPWQPETNQKKLTMNDNIKNSLKRSHSHQKPLSYGQFNVDKNMRTISDTQSTGT